VETEQNRFPSLSDMAKDILSILITTMASKSCFSMGGRIITKWRASLNLENAEALVITRSWLFGYKIDGGKFCKHIYFLFAFGVHALSYNKYIDFTCKYLVM